MDLDARPNRSPQSSSASGRSGILETGVLFLETACPQAVLFHSSIQRREGTPSPTAQRAYCRSRKETILRWKTRLMSESRADAVLGRPAPELEGRWHPRGLVEVGADEHHK